MGCIEKIYAVINDKCLKQSAIAKKIGFSAKAFNDILHSRKTFKIEYVNPICETLGITPNELFGSIRSILLKK